MCFMIKHYTTILTMGVIIIAVKLKFKADSHKNAIDRLIIDKLTAENKTARDLLMGKPTMPVLPAKCEIERIIQIIKIKKRIEIMNTTKLKPPHGWVGVEILPIAKARGDSKILKQK